MTALNLNVFFLFIYCCILSAPGQARQCPDDWILFDRSCYLFIDDIVPWSTAEAYCRILQAKLLEVETQQENEFVAAQIRARSGLRAVWQGVNDFVREGRWVFNSNGRHLTMFNWRLGQPDNNRTLENGQDCLQIHADGTWDDLWCEYISDNYPSPACEMDAQMTTVTAAPTQPHWTTHAPTQPHLTTRAPTQPHLTTHAPTQPHWTYPPTERTTATTAVFTWPHAPLVDPSDKSTFHDTHHLLWKDCGGYNAWLRLTSFDLTPSPLRIPGDGMLTLHVINGYTTIRNVALVVTVKKRLLSRWIDMPCMGTQGHQLGSCTYSDPCHLLEISFPGGQCPQVFTEQGLPCTCPFTIPGYKQININNERLTLPLPWGELSWLSTGEYYVNLALYQTGQTVPRMCFEFYLNLSH